jgi:PBP1b-binding outer membrane lipoprotein LpoB
VKRQWAAIFLAAIFLSGCDSTTQPPADSAQSIPAPAAPAPGSPDEVLATVRGIDITRRELDEPLVEAYGLNMLLELVQLDLAEQEAQRAQITITQQDVDDETNRTLLAFRAASNQDQLAAADTQPTATQASDTTLSPLEVERQLTLLLTGQHLTRTDFYIAMRRNAYLRKLVAPRALADLTEEHIHDRFNAIYGEKALVRFIRCPDMQSVANVDRELKAGQTFEEEVSRHAYDSIGRPSSGMLPPFSRKDLNYPPEFKMVAFDLKPGQVSDPFQYKDSIYLVQLIELIPPQHARYEDYRDSVRQDLYEQEPFKIDVSPRIARLPPYLFGRINKMKYDKRVAGIDIIDLGMGNPTDPTPEASSKNWPRPPAIRAITATPSATASPACAGSRPKISRQIRRRTRPRNRSHRHHRLQGRIQPSLPGAARPRRHRDRARSGVPHPHLRRRHGRRQCPRVPLGNDQAFLDRIERMIEGLYPTPKLLVLNYPHNPTSMTIDPGFWERAIAMCRRHGIMIISDFAYGEVCFDGYQAPSFLAARRQGTGRRIHDHVQELQHGRLALRLLRRQRRDGQGPGDHQRILRLRHLRPDPDRQHHRHARARRRLPPSRARSTNSGATSSAAAWIAGLDLRQTARQHVRLGEDQGRASEGTGHDRFLPAHDGRGRGGPGPRPRLRRKWRRIRPHRAGGKRAAAANRRCRTSEHA